MAANDLWFVERLNRIDHVQRRMMFSNYDWLGTSTIKIMYNYKLGKGLVGFQTLGELNLVHNWLDHRISKKLTGNILILYSAIYILTLSPRLLLY